MIVEWFMDVLQGILGGVAGMFPTGAAPGWLTDADSTVGNMLTQFGGMQTWVPIPLAVTVVTALLACWVVGFTIKLIRIVASFVTVGGGSAG